MLPLLQQIETPNSLAVGLTLATAYLLGLLVAKLLAASVKRFCQSERLQWVQWVRRYFGKSLYFLIPLLLMFPVVELLDPALLENYFWQKGVQMTTILFLIFFALGGLKALNSFTKTRYDISAENNNYARRMRTRLEVIYRVSVALIVLLGLGAILMLFEEMRGLGLSLLASAGVTGIVIGFSAQKVLGNLIAGIQIAFTQPISLEDAVVVEGEWGWIEEITLTYVVVKIWDRRRLVLPISYFVEKPFQNWTRNCGQILGSVYLYLDYRMPVEPLRRELDTILATTALWDKDAKVLQVVDATDKTMVLRALMTAKDSPASWDLRCHVRERLIGFIQQYYPQYLPHSRILLHEVPEGDEAGSYAASRGNGRGRSPQNTLPLDNPPEATASTQQAK